MKVLEAEVHLVMFDLGGKRVQFITGGIQIKFLLTCLFWRFTGDGVSGHLTKHEMQAQNNFFF